MRHTRWALLALCALLAATARAAAPAPEDDTVPVLGEVFELTDLNFDQVVNGTVPWLVDVFAPWCPACRELEPVWVQVAAALASDGVFVGKIDATKQRALMQRFAIRHFPSIYHVIDSETREYTGRRSLSDLVEFGRGRWRSTAPRRGCSSPVSRCGRLVGAAVKLPARAKALYFDLRDKRKYSDVTLFAGMLAVPVMMGLAIIFMLDVWYSRRPLTVAAPMSTPIERKMARGDGSKCIK